jgi:hypothetical protein
MHAYALDALVEDIDLTHEPTTTPLAFVFNAMCYPTDNNKSRRRGAPTPPGIPAAIMGDTGASCRFVSLKWCEDNSITIHKSHANWTVTVANDEEVQVCGYVKLEFNIQGYKDTATFLVMPMTNDYDIILGNDWAIARGAIFNFREKQLTVKRQGKDFILKPCRMSKTNKASLQYPEKDVDDDFDTTNPEQFVLNSAQAKRVVRKKLKNCTMLGVDYLGDTAELNAAKAKTVPPTQEEIAETVQKAIQELVENVRNHQPQEEAEAQEPDPEYDKESKALDEAVAKLILHYGESVLREMLPGIRMQGEPVEAIPTPEGAKPPVRGLGRFSKQHKEELDKHIKELLANGLIEPSLSPYAAAALVVPKYNPDGTIKGWRLVIDYRLLNAITIKYQYPMPRIDDVLDSINGARFFSSCDATWGFWQLRLHPEDIKKTAFRTPSGLYQWRVLPMGLSNSPAVFQRTMASFFQKEFTNADGTKVTALGSFIQVYMDDLLIYSKTGEEHAAHLDFVFATLRDNGIYLNPKKCEFNKPEVRFLGHLVSRKGVRPDPAKVGVMKEWPVPTDRNELYRFLGFANYFRQFIKNYATIASPLYPLTQISSKEVYKDNWTSLHQSCFEAIKTALTHAPTLKMPDFDMPFEVIVDASNIAIGAVLVQDGRPCAYESRKLTPAEVRWTTTERELFAAVHALKVWECYLRHPTMPFTLWTDHNPNTFFSTTNRPLTAKQGRWHDFLAPFNFQWKYKKGPDNIADALSRLPYEETIETTLCTIKLNNAILSSLVEERRTVRPTRKGEKQSTDKDAYSEIIRIPVTNQETTANEEENSGPIDITTPPSTPTWWRDIHRESSRATPAVSLVDPDAQPLASAQTPLPEHRSRPDNQAIAQEAAQHEPRPRSPPPQPTQAPVTVNTDDAVTPTDQYKRKRGNVETPATKKRRTGHDTRVQFDVGPEEPDKTQVYRMPSNLTAFERALWQARNDEFFKDAKHNEAWYQHPEDGLWRTRRDDRLIIPTTSLRRQVMEACHDSVFSGHFGKTRTLNLVERLFYWPKMARHVEDFCRGCVQCQQVKSTNHSKYGGLRPLPVPEGRWSDVTVDQVTGLPETARGFNSILVFVDRLTKMSHLAPTTDNMDSKEFCKLFMEFVIRLHGTPKNLISDRGSVFHSNWTRNHTGRLRIWQQFSTAYHPETDGQTERTNMVMEDVLRCYANANQYEWDTFLPMAEFAMNNAPSETTKFTPFLLNYGVHPRHPAIAKLTKMTCNNISLSTPKHRIKAKAAAKAISNTLRIIPETPDAIAFTQTMLRAMNLTKLMLHAARQRMMQQTANKRTEAVPFKVGQLVWLSTKYIKLHHEGYNKLMPRFCGPFEITKKINPVAFKLDLPYTMQIHDVFHASLLKVYKQQPGGTVPSPAPMIVNGEKEYIVEALLGRREKTLSTKKTKHAGKKKRKRTEYLVKWEGYSHAFNMWIPAEELLRNCKKTVAKYEETRVTRPTREMKKR